MEGFSMAQSTKRTAGPPSPHPIGPQSHYSTPPGSPPLGPCWAPALHGTAASPPHWAPAPQALPGPSSAGLPDSRSTRPPHGRLHRRAPNLPKRYKQTGLDAKGVTSEQLKLQFYFFRTGFFFFFFCLSLRVWLSGLLFDHPPSLPFVHFFLSFFLSLSFLFFLFFLLSWFC
jgi:hypothetical protein